ncbi:DUF5908 family protein [Sphaerotilaceae bacterium SBD11-9]
MTIEVRQLLVKSQLTGEPVALQREAAPPELVAQIREQILAECKAWLHDQLSDRLRDLRER